jgi:hypothetical protein
MSASKFLPKTNDGRNGNELAKMECGSDERNVEILQKFFFQPILL